MPRPSEHQTNPEFLTDFDTAFDYVVFTLDRYPQTGNMCTKTYKKAWKDIPMWNTIGYPSDRRNGQAPFFSDSNFILSHHPHQMDTPARFSGFAGEIEGYSMWTKIDQVDGQSGLPLYADLPGEDKPCVIGVLSSEGGELDRNRAAGGPALTFLVQWAREHDP